MPLPRNVYDIDLLVDDTLREHRGVVLSHADELRAELEGSKRALPQLPLVMTSLMLWAACARLGWFTGPYDEFRNGGLVEYRKVPAHELDVAGGEDVDPTPEAVPSGPASPSPLTSPEPSTGSPAYPSTTD